MYKNVRFQGHMDQESVVQAWWQIPLSHISTRQETPPYFKGWLKKTMRLTKIILVVLPRASQIFRFVDSKRV